MMAKMKKHPSVQKLTAQYDQLPSRDQKAVTVLVIAVLLALVYFAVWRPVADFRGEAVDARERSKELLTFMKSNQAALRQIEAARGQGSATSSISGGRELMSTVTRSAGANGLSLQRFEPSGDRAIRVWLENVPFNQVAAWLEQLNSQHGIIIDQAALDKGRGPGQVSVRLTLQI